MKEILILTGACGVGKSTIAKEWAKLKNGATVDCDYLTEWIYNKDFPRWKLEEEKFVARLASKIAIEYVKYGMSTSVENVWSPLGIGLLRDEIQSHLNVDLKVIWLYCEKAENHRRDRQRRPADQMKGRVDIVNDELANYNWPDYVRKIDTTILTVEETIALIEGL